VGGLGAGLDGGVGGSNGSELLVGGSCGNNSPEGGDRPVDNLLEVEGFAGNNPPELSMEGAGSATILHQRDLVAWWQWG